MIAVRRTVEAIQEMLRSKEAPDVARGAQLARDYARLCREANERLRVCAKYLEKELKGEALQLAHTQPDLIEMCDILDFDDGWMWRHLAAQRGWVISDLLDMRTFAALTVAEKGQTVPGPLVDAYRRAAVKRDDAESIRCLRKLIIAEPANAAWKEDLKRFESRRVGALEEECKRALQADDAAALRKGLAELAADWSVPPSSKLRQEVEERVRQHRRREVAAEAAGIRASLGAALESKEIEGVRSALEAWEGCVKQGMYAPSPEDTKESEQARAWLRKADKQHAKEAAFAAKVAELRAALERGERGFNPVPAWKELRSYGLPLPGELKLKVDAAEQALRERDAKRRRKMWMRLGTAAAVLLVAGVGVAWTVALRSAGGRWSQRLKAACERGDLPAFEQAKKEMESSTRRLFGNRVSRSAAVKEWLDREGDLSGRYRRMLADRDKTWASLEEARKGGFVAAPADVEAWLETARKLAQGSADNERLAAFAKDWKEYKGKRFASCVAEIEERLPEEGGGAGLSLDEAIRRAEEAAGLVRQAKELSGLDADSMDKLHALAERQERTLRTLQSRREQLQTLAAAKDLSSYLRAADGYARTYAAEPMGKALKSIADRRQAYEDTALIPPALSYARPSARIHFETLFEDVLYPAVSRENATWGALAESAIKMHRTLRAKWPTVRDALKGLGDDRLLTSMWQYKAAADGRLVFAELPYGREPAEVAAAQSLEASIYSPADGDRSGTFRSAILPRAEIKELRLMSHCRFVRQVVDEAGRLDATDADVYLLRKMRELHNNREADNLYLKLRIERFLAERFLELGVVAPLTDRMREFGVAARRLDEQVGLPWVCVQSSSVRDAEAASAKLLSAHFEDTADVAYSLGRVIAATCISRGARFAGAVAFDGKLPAPSAAPELIALRAGEKPGEQSFLVVAERGADGSFASTAEVLPMEPLFAPGGTNTTAEVLRECLLQHGLAEGPQPAIEWPAAWPANRRSLDGR